MIFRFQNVFFTKTLEIKRMKKKKTLKKYVGNQTGIMAKFEKPMAIKNMDEIFHLF